MFLAWSLRLIERDQIMRSAARSRTCSCSNVCMALSQNALKVLIGQLIKRLATNLKSARVITLDPIPDDSLRIVILPLENRRQQPLEPDIYDGVRVLLLEALVRFFYHAEIVVQPSNLFGNRCCLESTASNHIIC